MKRTTITGPNGEVTTINQENRGCFWWSGTIFVGLFLIGLVAVYPPLILLTIVIAAVYLALFLFARMGFNQTRPPLRRGRQGQPRWSATGKFWWNGARWEGPYTEPYAGWKANEKTSG